MTMETNIEVLRGLVAAAKAISEILDHPTRSVTALHADRLRSAVSDAEAALAALSAQAEAPEHVRRIRIPTETMEQEFQAYYRRGFEAGKKAAQPEADELLRDMGLDPERFRTEGGGLNSAKVRAAIRHPESYAGLYLPRDHDFGHSAKFGGEICFICGAAKGTPRADQPCVARPAPQQPEAQAGGDVAWDEWLDRFAETCDRNADAQGWVHLADGRVFGSRELYVAITSKIPPLGTKLYTTPPPGAVPEGVVRVEIAVVRELMDALHSFASSAEDDESYTVPSELMSRLAMLGAVYRAKRVGWYYLTDFGRTLLAAAPGPKEEGRG